MSDLKQRREAAMDVMTRKKIVQRRLLKRILKLTKNTFDSTMNSLLNDESIATKSVMHEGKLRTMVYLKSYADLLNIESAESGGVSSPYMPPAQRSDAKLYNKLSFMMQKSIG